MAVYRGNQGASLWLKILFWGLKGVLAALLYNFGCLCLSPRPKKNPKIVAPTAQKFLGMHMSKSEAKTTTETTEIILRVEQIMPLPLKMLNSNII